MTDRSILLHVGYHKTGTTWLQQHVFCRREYGFVSPMSAADMMDQIVIPNPLDFSASACHEEIERRLGAVATSGLIPVFSNERFSGHPHSGGYDSRVLADRLRDLFPDARVFICIREQKQIILSSYNQYVKNSGAISIASYINVCDRRWIPLFDFRHFMYHRLISYYQMIFGRENVLVLPFGAFAQDANGYVTSIIEFASGQPCSLDLTSLPTRTKTNRSMSGFELIALRMINYLVGARNCLNQVSVFPRSRERTRSLFRLAQKLNRLVPGIVNESLTASLERKVARLIGDRYCESNRITSELIGVDLAQFGFQM